MARTNIRQSLLDKWVDLDYNLNIIHRKYSPSSTSAFMQAFTHNPTEPVYDDSDPEAGGYSLSLIHISRLFCFVVPRPLRTLIQHRHNGRWQSRCPY